MPGAGAQVNTGLDLVEARESFSLQGLELAHDAMLFLLFIIHGTFLEDLRPQKQ